MKVHAELKVQLRNFWEEKQFSGKSLIAIGLISEGDFTSAVLKKVLTQPIILLSICAVMAFPLHWSLTDMNKPQDCWVKLVLTKIIKDVKYSFYYENI